ncbi:hypothetical protein AMS68_002699 [Peltaster fructicola]|uniref:Uncharacterized protein n=1 Tax=Peltaster fructicola TaxID=286661 RepID=A0A6H0XQY3_9PEZI|nr:hypothetical protein AMS68_002699 [Peltaster fructicola]
MDISALPPTAKLMLLGSAAFFLYGIVSFITLRQRRQSLQRAKGALPAVQLEQSERIFGWELFRLNVKNIRAHTILENGLSRFETLKANTFEVVMLGRKIIVTREPEILKTIQATDHKIWSLGEEEDWL